MGRRSRRRKFEPTPGRTEGGLDREGRARIPAEGARKELRVLGALDDEEVVYLRVGRRGDQQVAICQEVVQASPRRVEPPCAHANECGGCSLQHLGHAAQLEHKQAVLMADFAEHGVAPERLLEPIVGPTVAYRRRARLGVRWVEKKGRVLVGFREKRDSRFVADSSSCEILAGGLGKALPALAELIGGLSIRAKLPQIEVAVGDERAALIFRVLDAPSESDLAALRQFGEDHDLRIDLQPGGLDTVASLSDEDPYLSYRLARWDLQLRFLATDFVQVNHEVNELMIAAAIEELSLGADHRVLDLFCGIGNFTLPLAREAEQVLGVEGDEALVQRARDNAARNQIENARFESQNLYTDADKGDWRTQRFDRVLLDPPRSGAEQVLAAIAGTQPERIVYVACSPSTLARDAGILVREHGYVLEAAGIADMFPHTAHVESMAVFRRAKDSA
jgi:23S rRNA (uracil1939-C5)-methyltransferase